MREFLDAEVPADRFQVVHVRLVGRILGAAAGVHRPFIARRRRLGESRPVGATRTRFRR